MPILIKLLATNIVASSFLGRSKSREMMLNDCGCSSRPESISDFTSEKKATSAPDIRAEQSRRITNSSMPDRKDISTDTSNEIKLGGSGSKLQRLYNWFKREDHHQLLIDFHWLMMKL